MLLKTRNVPSLEAPKIPNSWGQIGPVVSEISVGTENRHTGLVKLTQVTSLLPD